MLRDVLGMTGTKFGCGQALCGACTVHVDGAATRSCITTVDSIGESAITTIEAIGQTPQERLHVSFRDVAAPLSAPSWARYLLAGLRRNCSRATKISVAYA